MADGGGMITNNLINDGLRITEDVEKEFINFYDTIVLKNTGKKKNEKKK